MSTLHHSKFPNVTAAIAAFQTGRPVLLLDDDDREDEADIVAAAENLSLQTMAMMIRDCSGIVCLCLDEATVDALQLAPMVQNNQARHGTGFTVTIEAAEGVSTGVSAQDRITTIEAALRSTAEQRHIVSPGHVFPLRARDGGVLTRRGHTEGSVDLARGGGGGGPPAKAWTPITGSAALQPATSRSGARRPAALQPPRYPAR
ncbi:3,4-dihydroxy-2-butanone-4-phosphate synthase, partial [Pseudomonas sp. NY15374]|uniref:3,4-dihydroxy-2-butanone-4-phosphate synthase n=1 Tax=Pseudomonas sp. NY15374 TaxID=3400357 RepID=UPI003A867EDE